MARPSWAPLCPDCGTQLRFRFSRVYGPDDRDADYVCPGCGATGTRREPHCAWARWNSTASGVDSASKLTLPGRCSR